MSNSLTPPSPELTKGDQTPEQIQNANLSKIANVMLALGELKNPSDD